MTTYNRTTLKTFFETGDVPTGTNYADLIDSCLNIVDTGAQSIAGPLNPTELVTPRVSANDVNVTGTLTVTTFTTDSIVVSGLSVTTASAATLYGTSIVAGIVSATSIYTDAFSSPSITTSAATITNGVTQGVGVVSAAGSTQATAATLINVINRGKGIVDGQTTGFTPPANRTGLVQYLFNEGASANLWPPVGGTINGLAVNTPFPLAASAMVTIVHLTASAMAVK